MCLDPETGNTAHMCVCVCLCARERESERDLSPFNAQIFPTECRLFSDLRPHTHS